MRGRKNTETAVCAVTFFLLSPRIRLKHTHTHTYTLLKGDSRGYPREAENVPLRDPKKQAGWKTC